MRRAMTVLLVLPFLLVLYLTAASAAPRTIRVGCPNEHVFMEYTPGGQMRGYLVAYLSRISDTTDWQYEYVIDSWENCYAMLENGQLDLLSSVEYSPRLTDRFSFSQPYVHDTLAVYSRRDDGRFFYHDREAFQHTAIGVATDMPHRYEFFHFLQKNQLSPDLQYFSSEDEVIAALREGTIDMALLRGTVAPKDVKIIEPLSLLPFYFLTTRQNDALLGELNAAMDELHAADPSLENELIDEFYSQPAHRIFSYTRQEMDLICSTAPIRVVCLKNQSPFEYYKGDTAVGIYPDLLRLLSEESGLPIEFLPADTMEEALLMIQQDQADAVLSTYRTLQTSDEMIFSQPLLTEKYTVIGRRDFSQTADDALTIAVPRIFRGIQDYIRDHHPNWTIRTCDSPTEALQLVDKGQADVLAMNTIRLQSDDPLTLYPSLTTLPTLSMDIPMNIAFSSRQPKLLRSIFDKTITRLEPKEIEHIVLNYTIVTSREFTPSYLLLHYPLQTGGFIALLLLLLLSGGFLTYHSRSTRKKNILLHKKNQELETALHHLESTIIDRDNYKFFAEKDLLTGLYNKLTMETAIKGILAETELPHALIIIDLDHFKAANDTYGHQYGDELLQRFAARLADAFRQEDLIGRFGGDEFLLFLTGMNTADSLLAIAEKIGSLARELDTRNGKPILSASIGIALAPEHGSTYEELFQAADQALYTVKENGRSSFCLAGRKPGKL